MQAVGVRLAAPLKLRPYGAIQICLLLLLLVVVVVDNRRYGLPVRLYCCCLHCRTCACEKRWK